MNKNYQFKLLKRRKPAICKNCEKPIEVNTNAYIVSHIEDGGLINLQIPTIVAIIHEECKNKVDLENNYSFFDETLLNSQ